MPTIKTQKRRKITLKTAEKLANMLVEAKLSKSIAEKEIADYESRLTEYCEDNDFLGQIGPLKAYTRKSPARLQGAKDALAALPKMLAKAYQKVVPRKVTADVKAIITGLEDADQELIDLLEDQKIDIVQAEKIYFKHVV